MQQQNVAKAYCNTLKKDYENLLQYIKKKFVLNVSWNISKCYKNLL